MRIPERDVTYIVLSGNVPRRHESLDAVQRCGCCEDRSNINEDDNDEQQSTMDGATGWIGWAQKFDCVATMIDPPKKIWLTQDQINSISA